MNEGIMRVRLKYIVTSCFLHGALLVLCAYAIGCCGFHILPVLGRSEYYDTINNTFLSLALSYVAGLVIYGLTSVMPKRQREKEVYELWKPHLTKLYNEMSERIEEVRAYVGIPKEKMDLLTEEDCRSLERYTDFPSEVWINSSYSTTEKGKKSGVVDPFSIKKRLQGHHESVHHVIDIMLDNPMAIEAEKNILDVLSQIKSSRFLAECNRIMDSSYLQNPPISINHSELPKAYCEYVKLRDKLGLLPIDKKFYDVRVLTDEEVKKDREGVHKLLAEQGYTMDHINAYSQQIAKALKR